MASSQPQPQTQPQPVGKRDLLNQIVQKALKQLQKEETKQWIQLTILDPVVTHILERIFPYILILTILFFLLTLMTTLTLLLVFTRVPAALKSMTLS